MAAAALMLAAIAGPALAQDPAQGSQPLPCPAEPMPIIHVVAEVEEYAYDHALPIAKLGAIKDGSATTSGHDVARFLALTRQSFGLAGNTTKAMTLERPDGTACVGYSDGTITLRLTTVIFIASELEPESCLYGEVRGHEERHANVGRRLFREFAATVEASITAALADAPFVEAGGREAAPRIAQARMEALIEPLYRDFQSTYRKRQAIIDTSGEYARVAATCPGEQHDLLGE